MADIASVYAFIRYVPIYGIKLSQITTIANNLNQDEV